MTEIKLLSELNYFWCRKKIVTPFSGFTRFFDFPCWLDLISVCFELILDSLQMQKNSNFKSQYITLTLKKYAWNNFSFRYFSTKEVKQNLGIQNTINTYNSCRFLANFF